MALAGHAQKATLRFLACGSVDDGKSTLIGRLLHESRSIFDDQLAALEKDSRQYGTQGDKIDFALLLDGLQAEREQGITIEVAYRFFSTAARRYIVADAPGHEQYTRNMATAASTADLAVILVDARKGVLVQTRRHTRIAAMMGIAHVVLAVNKMDQVGFDREVFEGIVREYRRFAAECGFDNLEAIPLCALDGDNVTQRSKRIRWYDGPSMLEYLDGLDVTARRDGGFRLPVRWVSRRDADFRGYCGRIAGGSVAAGDRVRILPSGIEVAVQGIHAGFDKVQRAGAGESVTLTFAGEVDASRGDVVVAAKDPAPMADQFEAKLLWLGGHALLPGRPYILKIHAKEVAATVTEIKYRQDIDSGAHLAAKTLVLNEIAVVNLSTSQPVVFEPYAANRVMGAFILIDKLTFETVAAGMIDFALRRASNILWQALDLDKSVRAAIKHQAPRCIWFTGLSGSGKSTIANLLEKRLHADGRHTYLLDGDNVRHGLNRDLGFTEADRVENIRRVSEVARLMVDAGLMVIVSFISPYRAERRLARGMFAAGEFVEVFVDASLAVCEARDPKGLYAKARRGELANFTGIDSAYEPPESAEVRLDTASLDPEESVRRILAAL